MVSMEQLISGRKYNFYKILVIFILFFCFQKNLNAAWLGVQMDLLKDKSAIIITATAENSPANDAGLKPGDIILSADGKTISGDKQIQNFIKFLKNKPLNSTATIVVKDKNGTKKNLTINFNRKESPKFPIWTIESKNYVTFLLETTYHFPKQEINQNYFSKKTREKYQYGTISCVPKASHAYSVGVRPYDIFISVNGEKFDPVKTKIKPGINRVKIKRGNQIIIKDIISTPSSGGRLWRLSEKYLDCTPEFSDYMCFEIAGTGKNLSKEETFRRDKLTYDCLVRNNNPDIPFHKVGEKSYNLKVNSLTFILNYLTFDKLDIPQTNKYLGYARNTLDIFDDAIEKKLITKESISETYNALNKAISNATTHAQGSGKELFKSKLKDKLEVKKKDIERRKKLVSDTFERNGLTNETINIITTNSYYLRKNMELDFMEDYLLKIKNQIEWNKNNLKYLDDVYEDLYDIYNQKEKPFENLRLLDEGLEIAKSFGDDLHALNAYGRFLQSSNINILLLWEDQKKMIKRGNDSLKLMKEYINRLDNLDNVKKDELYKLDKYHYTNIISGIGLLRTTFWTSGKDFEIYLNKGLNHIENSKYKDELWSSKFGMLVLSLQYYLPKDDLEKFTFNLNLAKSMIAESSGDYSKLLTIFNNSGTLFNIYYTSGLIDEGKYLLDYANKYFSRKELETNPVYRAGTMILDLYQARNLSNQKQHKEASIVLENVIKYSKFNNTLNPKTIYETVIIQNIIPLLVENYVELNDIDKINFYSKFYFEKDFNNITAKDFKNVARYYAELPEDGLRLYNSFLKQYIKNNNIKQISKLEKFLKNNLIKFSDRHFKKKTDMSMTNDLAVIGYLTEISLNLFKYQEKNALAVNILDYAQPKFVKHINNQLYQSIWRPGAESKEIAYNFLEASIYIDKKEFFNKAYEIAQLSKNTNTSRDLFKALKKQKIKGELGSLITEFNNVEREILVILRSDDFKAKDTGGKKIQTNNSSTLKDLNVKLNSLKSKISKIDPNYFNSLNIKPASINEIQKHLKNDESLLDYFIAEDDLFVVLINKNNFFLEKRNINAKTISEYSKKIRDSLNIASNLKPFPVNASYKLNNDIFSFLDKKIPENAKVIVVPDSYLNSVPLHLLSLEDKSDCKNCSDVKFNLFRNHFVYMPTAETLINLDAYKDKYKYVKTASLNQNVERLKKFSEKNKTIPDSYKNIKKYIKDKKWKKDGKSKILNKPTKEKGYIGIGDPDLYASRSNKVSEKQKITFIRGISGNKIKSEDIKSIYGPVNGSADELKIVSNFLDQLNTKILLKDKATEDIVKSQDFNNFDIIHFATHGEVSGALSGYNEPFLVLTPPQKVTNEEDGLLTMSEIMGLSNSASLVVLSACNTASGDQSPSEGFSGLTKGFFIAGSKNLMVSNWYVETYSTKDLITSFFNEAKNNNNLSISKNLNNSMIKFIKENKDKSHPVFWAPFVIVGNDQKLNI